MDNPAETLVGMYRHAAEGKRLFLHWSFLMPHQDIIPKRKGSDKEEEKKKTEEKQGGDCQTPARDNPTAQYSYRMNRQYVTLYITRLRRHDPVVLYHCLY